MVDCGFEIELVIFAKMDYMNDTATINSKDKFLSQVV